ncbi:MAG: hypothetical protein LBN24_09900 [Mediterranea sp.]|jgi:phenylpropionate dioxygenase-like ring-hydroxylating dioxygenase large terminal subunit|nr:hypothetical protein [Mediterranea sp.]
MEDDFIEEFLFEGKTYYLRRYKDSWYISHVFPKLEAKCEVMVDNYIAGHIHRSIIEGRTLYLDKDIENGHAEDMEACIYMDKLSESFKAELLNEYY